MTHLISVTERPDGTSHWVATGPAGAKIDWFARIVADDEGSAIAWESIEEAQVPNRGVVRFSDAPGGRGTRVLVRLAYDPPGGGAAAAIAKLFGQEPEQQVREDLRRFKMLLEAGEIATTLGQSSGRLREVKAERPEIPVHAAANAAIQSPPVEMGEAHA
jgi:uncharacterized membrane protein